MNNIGMAQLAPVAGYVVSIILGWLWLDARHEHAGAAERALIDSKLYSLTLSIADVSSTIIRYNTLESVGQLSDPDRLRRDELEQQRQAYLTESASLAQQRIAISD